MRAEQVEAQADARGIPRATVCAGIQVLRPVLEEALHASSRWRWVFRAGLHAVLKLLRDYEARNCASGAGGADAPR